MIHQQTLMTIGIVLLVITIVYLINDNTVEEGFSEIQDTLSEKKELNDPIFGDDATPNKGIVPPSYYFLDDGAEGKMSVQHNLCSKSCCSSQYPVPFAIESDKEVCANKDNYIPSRIMCNNAFQDAGCLCMTDEQGKFLQSRGGNN